MVWYGHCRGRTITAVLAYACCCCVAGRSLCAGRDGIALRVSSELVSAEGRPFDPTVVAETARIHEAGGFDRVLIGYFSEAPDGFVVGAHAASVTDRLAVAGEKP